MPNARPDAALVAACRGGEREAFVEIVRRHQSLVCAVAYHILGDVSRSEDVAQDTFVRAWRRLEELREPARLRGWLGSIASSLARNAAARDRRAVFCEDLDTEPDHAPAPDEAAADGEDAALVWRTLEKLPEALRLPLVLFYREGESVAAVAAALELSEDAVKQRLARGRAALREKVEALTSTVLRSTRPGVVFTFAVLGAAGILAAPSALAAAAFSGGVAAGAGMGGTAGTVWSAGTGVGSGAAGAAGAGSAGAGAGAAGAGAGSAAGVGAGAGGTVSLSKFSFFTAMTATHATPAIAALLALVFLPVGYQWSGAAAARRAAAPSEAAAAGGAAAAETAAGLPDLNTSALVAEWRRLHLEHGSTVESMPRLYEAILGQSDAFRQKALMSALVAEWTGLDAAGALAFFRKTGLSEQVTQVLREWMVRDARAVVKGLMASGPGWEQYVKFGNGLLDQIARATPDLLEDVIRAFPPRDNAFDTRIRDACRIAAERDPEGAARAAVALTGRVTESNQVEMLAGAAAAWAGKDPQAAWAWADALEDAAKKQVAREEVLKSWAAVDPVAALEHTRQVPGDPRIGNWDLGYLVVRQAAEKDFDLTVKWLSEHPDRIGKSSSGGLSDLLSEKLQADWRGTLEKAGREPVAAAALGQAFLNSALGRFDEIRDWLQSQPDSAAIRSLRDSLVNTAAWQEPARIFSWAGGLRPEQRTPELMGSMASSLLTSGPKLMDDLLPQAEAIPELATELIRTVLKRPGNVSGEVLKSDPASWVDRLERVPAGEERETATRNLAGAWAATDPAEAVKWAESMAGGKSRTDSFGAIAGRWADADSFEASQWVESLAAGAERDAAAKSLVSSVAPNDPEAALIWAKTITDSGLRLEAVTDSLKGWMLRDRDAALREVEALPLSSQEKATLRTTVETAAAMAGLSSSGK